LFVLIGGWVKILTMTNDGHEMMLGLRGEGDIVGEIGDAAERRAATAQAADVVHALVVPYDKFNSFLDANPGAGRAYRRVVTQRLKDADIMLRSRAFTTGAQRLAGLLLDLLDRHGREMDGTKHLAMPLSQEEMASLAGTSRATVTRAFSSWRKRGFIRTSQRMVTIIDPEGLRRVVAYRR